MADYRTLTEEMLEAFRAGLGRKRALRAKLEKVQRLRQSLERLTLTERWVALGRNYTLTAKPRDDIPIQKRQKPTKR